MKTPEGLGLTLVKGLRCSALGLFHIQCTPSRPERTGSSKPKLHIVWGFGIWKNAVPLQMTCSRSVCLWLPVHFLFLPFSAIVSWSTCWVTHVQCQASAFLLCSVSAWIGLEVSKDVRFAGLRYKRFCKTLPGYRRWSFVWFLASHLSGRMSWLGALLLHRPYP